MNAIRPSQSVSVAAQSMLLQRSIRAASLAVLLTVAGFSGAAFADETETAEISSEDGGSIIDWLGTIIGTLGDEGGSTDPESGTWKN